MSKRARRRKRGREKALKQQNISLQPDIKVEPQQEILHADKPSLLLPGNSKTLLGRAGIVALCAGAVFLSLSGGLQEASLKSRPAQRPPGTVRKSAAQPLITGRTGDDSIILKRIRVEGSGLKLLIPADFIKTGEGDGFVRSSYESSNKRLQMEIALTEKDENSTDIGIFRRIFEEEILRELGAKPLSESIYIEAGEDALPAYKLKAGSHEGFYRIVTADSEDFFINLLLYSKDDDTDIDDILEHIVNSLRFENEIAHIENA